MIPPALVPTNDTANAILLNTLANVRAKKNVRFAPGTKTTDSHNVLRKGGVTPGDAYPDVNMADQVVEIPKDQANDAGLSLDVTPVAAVVDAPPLSVALVVAPAATAQYRSPDDVFSVPASGVAGFDLTPVLQKLLADVKRNRKAFEAATAEAAKWYNKLQDTEERLEEEKERGSELAVRLKQRQDWLRENIPKYQDLADSQEAEIDRLEEHLNKALEEREAIEIAAVQAAQLAEQYEAQGNLFHQQSQEERNARLKEAALYRESVVELRKQFNETGSQVIADINKQIEIERAQTQALIREKETDAAKKQELIQNLAGEKEFAYAIAENLNLQNHHLSQTLDQTQKYAKAELEARNRGIEELRIQLLAEREAVEKGRHREQAIYNTFTQREERLTDIVGQLSNTNQELEALIRDERQQKKQFKEYGVLANDRVAKLSETLSFTQKALVDTNIAWEEKHRQVTWESEDRKAKLAQISAELNSARQHLLYTNLKWAEANEGLAHEIVQLKEQSEIDNGEWQQQLDHILSKKAKTARNGAEAAIQQLRDGMLRATLLYEHIQGEVPGYIEERMEVAAKALAKFDEFVGHGYFSKEAFEKAANALKNYQDATQQWLFALDAHRRGGQDPRLAPTGPQVRGLALTHGFLHGLPPGARDLLGGTS